MSSQLRRRRSTFAARTVSDGSRRGDRLPASGGLSARCTINLLDISGAMLLLSTAGGVSQSNTEEFLSPKPTPPGFIPRLGWPNTLPPHTRWISVFELGLQRPPLGIHSPKSSTLKTSTLQSSTL